MIDPAADDDTRRADQARAQLLKDIRQIKKLGDNVVKKTETAMHSAPVLLGLGAAGLALIGIVVLASRSGSRRTNRPQTSKERSFLAEAARSAALSALGILSGRVAQRLLGAAMVEPRPGAAPAPREPVSAVPHST